MVDTGRHRYFREFLGDLGGHGESKYIYEIYKGGHAGPFGDIGRHGDSKTYIFTNLIKGAMQGPSEIIWVIQVDIGTLKNCWMI